MSDEDWDAAFRDELAPTTFDRWMETHQPAVVGALLVLLTLFLWRVLTWNATAG